VPTIEIEVSDRIARHVASVRLMSYMVFPNNPDLRTASEITFRTKLADCIPGCLLKRRRKLNYGFCAGQIQVSGGASSGSCGSIRMGEEQVVR